MYNSFRTQKHSRVSTKSNALTQLKEKQSFGFFEAYVFILVSSKQTTILS